MSLDQFMSQFADQSAPEPAVPLGMLEMQPGALDAFIDKFNGVTEPYFFYNGEVELRFQLDEHIYYIVGPLGELTPQDGVTNIVHIIDKSMALVPWAAKVTIEKLMRTLPWVLVPFEKGVPLNSEMGTQPIDATMGYILPQITQEAFEKIAIEAKSAHKDALSDASDIGHIAHTWLEYYIKAVLAGFTQEVESKLQNLPKEERAANCVRAALAWMEAHSVKWIETERKIYSRKYGYAGTMDGLALVSSCSDPTCCAEQFKDRLTIVDWKSSNYLYQSYLYQTAAYEQAYEEEFGVEVEDRWIVRLGKTEGEFETWHCTAEDYQEDIEGFLDALSLTRSVKMTTERMRGQKAARKAVRKEIKEAAKQAEKAQRKEARVEQTAERRAAKAVEKELQKAAKKAERDAAKELAAIKGNKFYPDVPETVAHTFLEEVAAVEKAAIEESYASGPASEPQLDAEYYEEKAVAVDMLTQLKSQLPKES